MSIELPEASILADQMDEALVGKVIESYLLRDYERLHRIGFLNKDLSDFERLTGRKIEAVTSRGNVIRVKLDNGMNLILAPEYGGRILYHSSRENVPKFHLRADFIDGTILTTRLTSMGLIYAVRDDELDRVYVYKRDSSEALSSSSHEFTYERFSELLSDKNRMMKSLLVGKDAAVVGLSNSAFQDIIYRAGIHPKRKGSDLNENELYALYEAIKLVVSERLRLGGKDQFINLHGKRGSYLPAMGPKMKEHNCPKCGTLIERIQHGGGHVYLCPKCQR